MPRKSRTLQLSAIRRFNSSPEAITTDDLRCYNAAMSEFGIADKQEISRWGNNRVEDSYLTVRRRERAMPRFRRMKTLRKFATVLASFINHFNQERHLIDRQTFKERRQVAWAEWQSLTA